MTLYIREWPNGARSVYDKPTEGATAYVPVSEANRTMPAYARLDAERTAKPKTILTAPVVSTSPGGIGTLYPGPASTHVDTETGKRTELHGQASDGADAMMGALLDAEYAGEYGGCPECCAICHRCLIVTNGDDGAHDDACALDQQLTALGFAGVASRDAERKRRAEQ